MNKIRILGAVTALAAVLAGCGSSGGSDTASSGSDSGKPRIKFVINGTLGDRSFFDSAYAGLKKAESLGYSLKVVELGSDRTKWQSGFEDAASGDDYAVLAAGTVDTAGFISKLAPEYPDKKFWLFDSTVDYTGNNGCSNKCANVYSVTFKQNEAAYLAGFLAEKLVAEKSLPGAAGDTKVGVMGGVNIPVIEDFVVGFKAGFKAAGGNPSSGVLVQYVGGQNPFGDPAKGKEIASSMYEQGAALVWPVAGSSGLGVFESAVAAKRYTFGVDSDQSKTLTDPAQQQTVVTSILKNAGNALYPAAKENKAGSLAYGKAAAVGLTEGGVGYVDNAGFEELVPTALRTELKDQAAKIASGAVKVPSAF
ncbi:BMP family ABC transporter substrate-binding protein [Streptomyces ipomoeae]|uniref:BMP family ABC transporter substrate-binding protein n=1 Tax=Streptomyces ipomoeae TaxID=103232 RepID=UPI0011468840|nr:BMP family ABC transporter substrate-binding protein [Streptomyces ipomoeae]MDX2939714.1 BMP family ABC transporter substrate-binding protein [Streptomyces ipomoeae]TQE29350.1 BMP family ABC transporter substrate-binding protein [Streptomyces ipomoeae]